MASMILSATHLVFGAIAADRLAQLGAVNVVCANDRLVLGPSRRDVAEHVRARSAWWGIPPEAWDRLYAPDVRWERPIVVWTSASTADTLNLWRACSRLQEQGLSERDVLVIRFEPAPRRPGAVRRHERFECSESLGDFSDEILLNRLSRARPFSRARFARAVDLWRRFVQPNPLGFARRCAREAPDVWALLSSFFPRVTPSGLRLSRFDEQLLNVLSMEEWKTTVRLYANDDEEWQALLCCTGDVWLPGHLDRWTEHGPTPAVERAPGPRPDVRMKEHVYRLTERGARLRAGLERLTDAPPLPIGGTEAYGAPWAVRDDGRLVRYTGGLPG